MCSTAVVVGFLQNLNIVDKFSKNSQMSNFLKILAVEPTELFRANGRTDTDMGESNSRFSRFCERA